jgi:exodeoxyribonuclease VII large subunit
VSQLDAIFQREQEFDAVVIIRGGGARSDLRWFDSYEIAANVAQFPLPVITGIGHDKDQSITDLVANTSLKTPTAVAEFIVSTAAEYAEELDYYHERIKDIYDEIIEKQEQNLQDFMSRVLQSMKIVVLQTNGKLKEYQNKIQYASVVRLNAQKNDLSNLQQRLKEQCNRQLFVQQKALDLIETKILAKNPETILQQGYTITTDDSGEIIKSVTQIPDSKTIITHFSDGEVTSHIS